MALGGVWNETRMNHHHTCVYILYSHYRKNPHNGDNVLYQGTGRLSARLHCEGDTSDIWSIGTNIVVEVHGRHECNATASRK